MLFKPQQRATYRWCGVIAFYSLTTILLLTADPDMSLAQAPNYSSLVLDNQTNSINTTQLPLAIGNLYNSVNSPLFNFYTTDNGTGTLNLFTNRWGTEILFSRQDPSNNWYNVANISGSNTVGGNITLYNTSNQGSVLLNSQGATYFTGGNVLIGKTSQVNTSYLFDVNGSGRLNEVVVNTGGADYVFDSTYRLPTLEEIDGYIHAEHHLPGIDPAARMQQEGVRLGDNQTRLLAKIEELTLYLIEQDKESQGLKEKIKTLEQRNQILENLEQRIEQRIERLEHPDSACQRP